MNFHSSCEEVGADIFSIHNNTLLYIVDYYSKFSVMKKADGLSADDLVRAVNIFFTEFGPPKKMFSDVGINFISDQLKQFYRWLKNQAILSTYYHQCNGQVEVYITFVIHTIKICFDNNNDVNLIFVADKTDANRCRIT